MRLITDTGFKGKSVDDLNLFRNALPHTVKHVGIRVKMEVIFDRWLKGKHHRKTIKPTSDQRQKSIRDEIFKIQGKL